MSLKEAENIDNRWYKRHKIESINYLINLHCYHVLDLVKQHPREASVTIWGETADKCVSINVFMFQYIFKGPYITIIDKPETQHLVSKINYLLSKAKRYSDIKYRYVMSL